MIFRRGRFTPATPASSVARMEMALALTETQTERLHRVAEFQRSTTYEVVFLALEQYLAEQEDEYWRSGAPWQAERRRELLRTFAGLEHG
jgi:hypothetical protein